MSLASADLPSDPDALRAFALACQSELAATTAELQAAKLAVQLHNRNRVFRFARDSPVEGAVTSEPVSERKFPVRWENTGYSLIFGPIFPNLPSKSQC